MLDPENLATIRRVYYAEHWKIGTIAAELGVHRDTVRAAIETDPLHRPRRLGPPLPQVKTLHYFLPAIDEVLQHPLDTGYVEYLAAKLKPFASKKAALLDER